MGVKGLPAYLRRHAATAFLRQRSVDAVISTIRGEHAKSVRATGRPPAVAVDVPSLFYRVMYGATDVGMGVYSFLQMFEPLRAAGVRVMFIFDNPHKPNKGPERERRRARAATDRQRLQDLKDKLETTRYGPADGEDVSAWMEGIEETQGAINKVAKRVDIVRSHDFVVLDVAMVASGYTTWLAQDEGEAAAAALYHAGAVDAVISEDFDVLPLGVGMFIRNYGNWGDKRPCEAVPLSKVLSAIQLPFDTFLQMCILCGTDFTHHLHGMGPVKARKMLGTYKNLANYLASADFRNCYGDVDFDWRTAVAQFRDVKPPCLTRAAVISAFVALVHRLTRK